MLLFAVAVAVAASSRVRAAEPRSWEKRDLSTDSQLGEDEGEREGGERKRATEWAKFTLMPTDDSEMDRNVVRVVLRFPGYSFRHAYAWFRPWCGSNKHPTADPALTTPPAEVKVLLLLPVIKMLPKCCSARQICCCFCCCCFYMLSVALSEVLCRQQIREPISKMLTPSIGQLNSFFIHLTLRLCPTPNPIPIPSLDTVGSPVETKWHIALHSTPLHFSLWYPIFSWMNLHSPNTFLYFYLTRTRIQSHLWFEFADDNRRRDLRGKLIEFICITMNNY